MKIFSKWGKRVTLKSPVKGEVHPISVTSDESFANKSKGDGVVILPSDGHFYAPISGEVTRVSEMKNIVCIESKGIEIMVHVGIDTEPLNGDGYKVYVEVGQKVKQGDLLIKADLEYIKAMGYSSATPVVVTNKKGGQTIEISGYRHVTINDDLFDVVK